MKFLIPILVLPAAGLLVWGLLGFALRERQRREEGDAEARHRDHAHVAARHRERAVREVHEIHEAHRDGEPHAHQEEQAPVGDAIEEDADYFAGRIVVPVPAAHSGKAVHSSTCAVALREQTKAVDGVLNSAFPVFYGRFCASG